MRRLPRGRAPRARQPGGGRRGPADAGASPVRLRDGGVRVRCRGAHSDAEKAFLDGTARDPLGLDAARAEAFRRAGGRMADAPSGPFRRRAGSCGQDDRREMDGMILNYAIRNGALELLPQNLASMAGSSVADEDGLPHRRAHGFELDAAREGLPRHRRRRARLPVLEQFGRKLVGGLLGPRGGLGRALGSAATGAGFSFASTYALGQVAKRYYAGGGRCRRHAAAAFAAMLARRKACSRVPPQIEERAPHPRRGRGHPVRPRVNRGAPAGASRARTERGRSPRGARASSSSAMAAPGNGRAPARRAAVQNLAHAKVVGVRASPAWAPCARRLRPSHHVEVVGELHRLRHVVGSQRSAAQRVSGYG